MLSQKTNNNFKNRIFTSFMFIRARSFTSTKKKKSPLHILSTFARLTSILTRTAGLYEVIDLK